MKRGSGFAVGYCGDMGGDLEVVYDLCELAGGGRKSVPPEEAVLGSIDMRSMSCCNLSRSADAWLLAELALFCSI